MIIKRIFLVVCLLLLLLNVTASAKLPPQLEEVKIDLSKDVVKVIVRITDKADYKSFKLNDTEPRIVIDLYDTVHNWPEKELVSQYPPVKKVRTSQFRKRPQEITRIVLDLTKDVSYTIERTKESLEIILPASDPQTLSSADTATPQNMTLIAPTLPDDVSPPKVPVPEAAPPDVVQRPQGAVTNDLISLNFERADVRDVLTALGMKKGINMILEDDVIGEVTINLQNISFKEALSTILKIKNLAMEEISSQVIRITTKEKAELTTLFLQLKYAKAEEIINLINNLLSARGKIQVDKRTNGILITETTSNIDVVLEAIKKVDIKTFVVEIKAEIVEVDTNALRELGINWSLNKGVEKTFPAATTLAMNQTNGTMNLTVGTIIDTANLQAALSVLGSKGKSRLLSSPRITTIDNQSAKIIIGDKVPYEVKKISTSAPTGGEAGVSTVTESTIEFLDVGIILDVTPTINVDKQVTMKLKPQVSTYTPSDLGPVIHTREAETAVVINDNQTIVIGGLMREDERDITQYVPFIGNIPIIGLFFQRNSKRKDNTELLIFITPKIIE